MVKITEDLLRAVYEMLCLTAPFNRWNLPDGDDVVFKVIKDRRVYGWYVYENGIHKIAISESKNGHLNTITSTVAHELIHLHQKHSCMETAAEHNAAFYKLAKKVCEIHGWDPALF